MSPRLFACHKSKEPDSIVCAGFLERGADHNMTVRLAYIQGDLTPQDRSGGLDLVENYVEMAVRNGVDPSDPALEKCR